MRIPRLLWQRVQLNVQSCSDVQWRACFLSQWNGISFFPSSSHGGHKLVSDASGTWGCGAFVGESLEWFQIKWPDIHIAAKLFPIVIRAAVWGSGSWVLFLCNNQAVVSALSSRAVRGPTLIHLIQCLFFLEAHFKFEYTTRHISGKHNTAADALSCNQLDSFLTLYPLHPDLLR